MSISHSTTGLLFTCVMYVCRFLVFNVNFAVLCHTIAIWLTIALAIFRYICVCYPTRGAALCSLQRAKLAICAIYVTSAVVCIPNYMVTSSIFVSVYHHGRNKSTRKKKKTKKPCCRREPPHDAGHLYRLQKACT